MRNLIIIIAALFIIACGVKDEDFAKIELGMNATDAEAIIGSAWDVQYLESEGDEVWHYGTEKAIIVSGGQVIGIKKEGEETEMIEGVIMNELGIGLPTR